VNVERSASSARAGRAKEDIDINIEIASGFGKVMASTDETSGRAIGALEERAEVLPRRQITPERAASYVKNGYWDSQSLSDGVEAAGILYSNEVALADNRQSLTWTQLGQCVSKAVTTLAASGVTAGDQVVVIAGNSAEGVVAYHGLLRVGATMVLLDRRCGPADLRAAREALQPTFVVASLAECERLGSDFGSMSVIALEQFAEVDSSTDVRHQTPEPERDRVAVVLFTSGTTSRPKAVTHSINTLTRGAANMALITEADTHTVIFLVSPLTSITGVMQMHLAADHHATLVLEDDFDPESSLERINQHGASLLGGAPVIVERLINAVEARPDRDCSLDTLALGGAMLPRPLLERVMREYGIKVARVYGSSEAPNATGSLPEDGSGTRLADDGALMPGTEVRVGSQGHPQEGLIRGPGVFLGYIDESDNAAAFEGDWYRTGDLVEVTEGRLTVVGRLKEVVNRNGLKISLAEIDGGLFTLPGVEECASFALPDRVTGERLAVAILPSPGSGSNLDDVVNHLRVAGVPARRLPEELVIWDEPLPRTATGKIIRSRLVMDAPTKKSIKADRVLRDQEGANLDVPATTRS
jgi:acyl-CoA synthetase (AMP-forming)/AMP-acid ligase II